MVLLLQFKYITEHKEFMVRYLGLLAYILFYTQVIAMLNKENDILIDI